MPDAPTTTQRIAKIDIDQKSVVRWSADIEHERKVAIFDLLEENSFAPIGDTAGGHAGPYHVLLSVEDDRLVFALADTSDAPLGEFRLSMQPFRRVVKDYFKICESYFMAIKAATPQQIETIDMARRGVHNEGSEILQERLDGKAQVDFDTARRLFTLICVLHLKV